MLNRQDRRARDRVPHDRRAVRPRAVELALLGAQCGVFPAFTWERGKGGKVLDCPLEAKDRPGIEEFMARQRRFQHMVKRDATGKPAIQPGREQAMERLRGWVQENVERLYRLAEMK